MKKLTILLAFGLLGCLDPNQQEHTKTLKVCDCEQKKEMVAFMQNSIKNANNMSDEEMEDVISQLEKTAIRTICSDKTINFIGCGYGCQNEIITSLDSCQSVYFY